MGWVYAVWYASFIPSANDDRGEHLQIHFFNCASPCLLTLARTRDARLIDCSHDANPYDLLYVVGAFDTICKTCQQQYCSAGVWTGQEFDKAGGGVFLHIFCAIFFIYLYFFLKFLFRIFVSRRRNSVLCTDVWILVLAYPDVAYCCYVTYMYCFVVSFAR